MTDKLNLQRLDQDPRLPMIGSVDFERVLYVRLYELFRDVAGVTNRNGEAISGAISNITTQLTEDINQAIEDISQAVDGAMQKSANLGDVGNVATARSNLGLGNVDDTSDVDKPVSSAAQAALGEKVDKANNLSDLQDAETARNNLGLGTAAIADIVGTMAGGAIIEQGSNSAGEWVKFADGTMIVSGAINTSVGAWSGGASLRYAALGNFSYAAEFSAPPNGVMVAVDGQVAARSAYLSYYLLNANSASGMYASSSHSAPGAGSLLIRYVLKGRWD